MVQVQDIVINASGRRIAVVYRTGIDEVNSTVVARGDAAEALVNGPFEQLKAAAEAAAIQRTENGNNDHEDNED